MIKINYLILICVFITLNVTSQNKVCENSQDELADMNTIGKCAIEEFKKSNKKEFVKVQTRNRFVRKRNNSYLAGLKKNLSAAKTEKVVTTSKTTTNKTNIAIAANTSSGSELLLKDYVRFDQVNDIPVFITCADAPINAKTSCVKETFINTILDNFTYPFDAAAEGIEGTVWVRFIIDTEGYVKNVTTKGPENGALLEKEAKRLVTFLPKFVPGKHNNNFVNVEYFMPIEFQLDE